MTTTRNLSLVLVAAGALLLGACGNSDDSASSTTTSTTSTTAAPTSSTTSVPEDDPRETIRFNKAIQQELVNVGCYTGAVDGIFGPRSDAAVVAFQTAAGLKVDGELGPETEATLLRDSKAKKVVCTAGTTTTKAPASTTTTTSAPNDAPCTAAALLKGLPAEGEKIGSFVCSEGWAAGTLSDGTTKFLLQAKNGTWVAPSQDPCGSASAGIPPIILTDGCG